MEQKQPHTCSDPELYDGIDRSHAAACAAQHVGLAFIREFDKRELWRQDGCRHMGEWLAGRLGISMSEGLRRTKAAHALARLPLISNALEVGRFSLDKAEQLARFATPTTEAELLRWARRANLSAIWKRADRETRKPIDEVRAAHEERYLQWWTFDETDSLQIQGLLPSDQAAAFTKAVDRMASKLARLPDEDGDIDRRRADALVMLASGQIANDPDADRATVVLHAHLTDEGRRMGAAIERGAVLHPEVARRMSCDCRLQPVFHGSDGGVLGIGRTSRNIPPSLMRVLMERDGGCTFPSCGTKRFVDGHHIWHWEDGGPTELDNLVVVCRFHHDLIHKFAWTVTLEDNQVARWYRPDGRLYEVGPKIRSSELLPAPTDTQTDVASLSSQVATLFNDVADPWIEQDDSFDRLPDLVDAGFG